MITDIELKYNKPDPRIKWAREYNDTMLLHVHGIGLSSALSKINHYENDFQKEARDLFAYSNKHTTARLLAPAKNIFSAKGGTFDYNTINSEGKEDLRAYLSDVYNGYSLSMYMSRIVFDKFITDPNGIIQVIKAGESYKLDYVSIKSIRNYEQSGIYLNWIVFEPYETGVSDEEGKLHPFIEGLPNKIAKKYERFMAVDEVNVYEYIVRDKKFTEVSRIPHNQKRVPAILCSDIENPINGWKMSIIDNQIELLRKVMDDNSVLNIVEKFHNFPVPWAIVDDCPTCHGMGVIMSKKNGDGVHGEDITCPVCGGDGSRKRKDPTDTYLIRVADDQSSQLREPAGYITLPTEPWELMVASIDRTIDTIINSHWGSSMEYGKIDGNQYATATGRWLDVQPVTNKLNEYSDSIEFIHAELCKMLGQSYMPETFKGAEIHYGRNYLLETTSQLLKTYNEINQYGENLWMLDIVSTKWLETEYKDNETMLAYYGRLSALDPLPHNGLDEVLKTGIPDAINRKLFLNDYKHSRSVDQIIKMSVSEVIEDYRNFINEKTVKNGRLQEDLR